jgi:hypothetical protein
MTRYFPPDDQHWQPIDVRWNRGFIAFRLG